jgi:hypothetical protein
LPSVITDHAALSNLTYASSGHTGFESQTNAQFVSGNLVTRINGVSSSIHEYHNELQNLSYASSGHTGFESQTNAQFVSGNLVTRINGVSSSIHEYHNELQNLAYATSGHTGFESQANAQYVSSGINARFNALPAVVTVHSSLTALDYASSGHTGFESSANAQYVSSGINARISALPTSSVVAHSELTQLDYASAGHTGFAGTGVGNTFTSSQTFQGGVTVTGSVNTQRLQMASGAVAGYYLVASDNAGNARWTSASVGGGTTNHAALLNLDYASSGHTGFQSAADAQYVSSGINARFAALPAVITDHAGLSNLTYAASGHTGFESQTNAQFVSGNLVTRINNVSASIHEYHNELQNLSYATSGHTGFESQTNAQFVSGNLVTRINSVSSSIHEYHNELQNLSYATSGHTGFESQVNAQFVSGNMVSTMETKVNAQFVSGNIVTRMNSISASVVQEVSDRAAADLTLLSRADFANIGRYGFLNQTETTLSFDGSSVFTVAPVSSTWSYWRMGLKHTITGSKNISLAPLTQGQNFIYIDDTAGTLSVSSSPWSLLSTVVPVAEILWNSGSVPKYWIGDERHTVLIDRRSHYYEHSTNGTQVVTAGALSGLTVDTDNDAAKTFGVSATVIADEDIVHSLPALTDQNGTLPVYTVMYRTAPTVWAWTSSSVPFKYNTATNWIQWDNSGALIDATGGGGGGLVRWVNSYLLFTNLSGSAAYTIIPGRATYTSLAAAEAENLSAWDYTGFPLIEASFAYRLTWSTITSTSTGQCRLAATPTFLSIGSVNTVGSGAAIDHNSLTTLQGGLYPSEYYHLSSEEYSGNLANRQVTVGGLRVTGSVTVSGSLAVLGTLSGDGSLLTNVTGSLTKDHAGLTNLAYATSGHTGFQSSADAQYVSSGINARFNALPAVVTVHSSLSALDYASSGHTGFESSANAQYVSSGINSRFNALPAVITDHAGLSNLTYASSGHTGFESQTNAQFVSGNLVTRINNVSASIHEYHNELQNLSYATSGHTGFESQTNAQFVSGNLVTRINGVSSSIHEYHNELQNLAYATSGHTGFQSSADAQYVSSGINSRFNALPAVVTVHSGLTALDYASSGHTGFESSDHAQYVSSGINSRFAGLPAVITDHAGLSNLPYATSGHTGFAGTAVSNTFIPIQHISGGVVVSGSLSIGNFSNYTPYSAWSMRATANTLALAWPASSGWAIAQENEAVLMDALDSSGNVIGTYNRAMIPDTVTGAPTTLSGAYIGAYSTVQNRSTKAMTGSTIQMIGHRVEVAFWGATGNHNQVAGEYITVSNGLGAPATITTAYGLYIDPVKTADISNAYGLYIPGTSDLNIVGGWLGVGNTAAPTDPLVVTGRTKITGDLVVTGSVRFSSSIIGDGALLTNVTGSLTKDHAGLTNLAYATSGHTGFAGTDVVNAFSAGQRITGNLQVTGSVYISSALTAGVADVPTNHTLFIGNTGIFRIARNSGEYLDVQTTSSYVTSMAYGKAFQIGTTQGYTVEFMQSGSLAGYVATTKQLVWNYAAVFTTSSQTQYDVSNYYKTTVAADGSTTIDVVGSVGSLTIQPAGNLLLGTASTDSTTIGRTDVVGTQPVSIYSGGRETGRWESGWTKFMGNVHVPSGSVNVSGSLTVQGSQMNIPRSITVDSPVSGDNITWFRTPNPLFISEIAYVLTGGSPVTASVYYGASRASGTLVGTTIVTSTTNPQIVRSFSASAIPSGSVVWLAISGSVGAAVTSFHCDMYF